MTYIPVVEGATDTPVELPLEEDSTLLLTTLQATFPNACGLVFQNSDNGKRRGIRLMDGKFHAPDDGWSEKVLICTFAKEEKRKLNEEVPVPPKKKPQPITDLIILGLPWKTNEDQVRDYFQTFGDVDMVSIKKDSRTGQSKGFGFVRFSEFSSQSAVIEQRHMIDGRWCDVKIPYSQSADSSQACKIFVGQLKNGVSQDDLRDYFSEFGDVTDVYIPQPFRMFAFVSFTDPFTAKYVCEMKHHAINGSHVNVSVAVPPTRKSTGGSWKSGSGNSKIARRHSNGSHSDESSFFNSSGEWNNKQGRNSLVWDENEWNVGGRGTNF